MFYICICVRGGFCLLQDSTFDFEKQRNRPVKYDRELMGAAINTMKVVAGVQERREKEFHTQRMKVKKAIEKHQIQLDIKQNVDLLQPAAAKVIEKEVQVEQINVEVREEGQKETKISQEMMAVN